MTATYDLIASNVLTSSASSVTFSSIPATYRDLVLVIDLLAFDNSQYAAKVRFNGDTGLNYSLVLMRGNGSSTTSFSGSDSAFSIFNSATTTERVLTIFNIMDYAATDKHKTGLQRTNATSSADPGVSAVAQRWANTAAISSISISTAFGQFATTSSFHLYGIVS